MRLQWWGMERELCDIVWALLFEMLRLPVCMFELRGQVSKTVRWDKLLPNFKL